MNILPKLTLLFAVSALSGYFTCNMIVSHSELDRKYFDVHENRFANVIEELDIEGYTPEFFDFSSLKDGEFVLRKDIRDIDGNFVDGVYMLEIDE